MTEKIVPYHRRTAETAAAWAAFVLYRNLGPNRTLTEVSKELNKSVVQMSKWSTKYEWKKRALAYDRENENAKRKAELAALEDMRKRHIEGALLLQDIGKTELQKIQKHAKQSKALAIEPKEAREFLKDGNKQERLNRGEPSEIVHTIEETPLSIKGLPEAEVAILRGIYMRLKAKKEDSGKELSAYDDDIDGNNETDIIDI